MKIIEIINIINKLYETKQSLDVYYQGEQTITINEFRDIKLMMSLISEQVCALSKLFTEYIAKNTNIDFYQHEADFSPEQEQAIQQALAILASGQSKVQTYKSKYSGNIDFFYDVQQSPAAHFISLDEERSIFKGFRNELHQGNKDIALAILKSVNDNRQIDLTNRLIEYCYIYMFFEGGSSGLDQDVCTKLLTTMQRASTDELELLMDIIRLSTKNDFNLRDFFEGAHIRIKDNGEYYKKWCVFENKYSRDSKFQSSHHSDHTQYAIDGELVSTCLFGTKVIEGITHSWIQAESHAFTLSNPLAMVGHSASFVRYRFSGLNQGPHGESTYTETEPAAIKTLVSSIDEHHHHTKKLLRATVTAYLTPPRPVDDMGNIDSDGSSFSSTTRDESTSLNGDTTETAINLEPMPADSASISTDTGAVEPLTNSLNTHFSQLTPYKN